MGVSFEDVAAVEMLLQGIAPPVANYEVADAALGTPLNVSRGERCEGTRFVLRMAAGFGSHIAFSLYAKKTLA
eukprot:g5892.t1